MYRDELWDGVIGLFVATVVFGGLTGLDPVNLMTYVVLAITCAILGVMGLVMLFYRLEIPEERTSTPPPTAE
jgi:hypothetical protein